jgi:hypothetical protein
VTVLAGLLGVPTVRVDFSSVQRQEDGVPCCIGSHNITVSVVIITVNVLSYCGAILGGGGVNKLAFLRVLTSRPGCAPNSVCAAVMDKDAFFL